MLKKGLAVLIALFVMVSGIPMDKAAQAASSKTKYVTASTLNVRSGPSTTYKVITTVKKNT